MCGVLPTIYREDEKERTPPNQGSTYYLPCFLFFHRKPKMIQLRYTHFGSRVPNKQPRKVASQEGYVSQKYPPSLEGAGARGGDFGVAGVWEVGNSEHEHKSKQIVCVQYIFKIS